MKKSSKVQIEFVTKWQANPQALVDRINANKTNCRLSGCRGDERFHPKTVFEATLKFGKFIVVNCGGSLLQNGIPIYEGIDRIEFPAKNA
jgi:hypothetical protein